MSIVEDLPPHSRLDGLWAGKIATNPANFDALVDVVIDTISENHRIGPCPWTAVNGLTLPVRGDICLVAFDENERPYVVAWWTSGGSGLGPAGTADIADGAVTTPKLADSAVTNIKVDAAAAIGRSKLNFGSGLVNADLAAAAAIAYSKLNLAGFIKKSDFSTTLADRPVGDVLTNDEKTSDTTVSATTEATGDTVVTSGAFTYNGSTFVMIEFYCPSVQVGANGQLIIDLWDDTAGVAIGRLGAWVNNSTTLSLNTGCHHGKRRIAPASGSRVYSIRAWRVTANGVVSGGTGGSGATMPAFIRITKA